MMKRNRFFLSLVWENRYAYLAGVAALGATLWMSLSIPLYLQQAVDLLSTPQGRASGQVMNRIGWILLFALAIMATRTLSRMLFFTPGRKVEYDLKNRLLAHLATLQRDFFAANPTGALISRINNDINGIRLTMGFGLLQFFNSMATLSLAPYYMYRISPALTLYVVATLVGGFSILQVGLRLMRDHQFRQMDTLQRLSDFIVESYNGIEVIKGVRAYPWTEHRFDTHNDEVLEASVKIANVRAFFMPILSHLTNGLKVLLVLLGGMMVIEGQMTIGAFLAYLLYLTMLVPPLMGLTFMMFVLQRGFAALASLEAVLATQPTLAPAQPEKQIDAPFEWKEGIRVEGLTFAYPDQPGTPVLEEVSLSVSPGEIVGLFGQVGSGKTSLVNLLNRYLQAPKGAIRLDGHELNDIGQKALREMVVTVTQDPFLFSETVEENITFGGTGGRLEETVRAAALSSDLERLPLGLQTLVGEKGITLSGGQKQRIALARAMMKPCQLLILDDPLSAVDHETERRLIDSIYGFQHSRSLLIVSHRVSVLERAHRIVVLEQGRVSAVGTHSQLTAQPGPYQTAWRLQSERRQTGEG